MRQILHKIIKKKIRWKSSYVKNLEWEVLGSKTAYNETLIAEIREGFSGEGKPEYRSEAFVLR